MPKYIDPARHTIHSGPSKYDLMLALFDGSAASGTQRLVTFTANGMDIVVRVNGVMREDGSGESWIVNGYTDSLTKDGPDVVEAYYSTQNRRGTLQLSY